ncbi:LacI family DNA-binding transcriptional regulator [Micromonospora sp. NPDC049559]|uniref:LacI family DNA-binding transcriptional regulator n=1 Tax=Micromonospora sp. NPDC049559 TaxID=3155923 RepID=UPI00343C5F13
MTTEAPTLMDVARAAGVSRSAVSRVLNDEPGVAPEVRDRVRRLIAELGYRPNAMARALARGHAADLVELVVIERDHRTFGANPHYGRIMTGVLDALAGTDVQMRVVVADEARVVAAVTETPRTRAVGSVLVNVAPDLAAELARHRDRIVSMGRSAPRVPYAEPENANGVRAAIQHLYALGRRRIAAIHGPQNGTCGVERRLGYLDAMAELGLPTYSAAGDFTRETALASTRRLIGAEPEIDAIVAACDQSALGALQALTEAGRRVPDDVALVGFDNGILAVSANPPLTSVHHPVEEVAATATRQLLQRRQDLSWHAAFPTPLVVRKSSVG